MEKKISFKDIYRKIGGYVILCNKRGVVLLEETEETNIKSIWKFYNREVLGISPVNDYTMEICIGGPVNEE